MPHTPPGAWTRLAVAVSLAGGLPSGCADPSKTVGFDEKDPGARLRAVRQAACDGDPKAVRPLIELLDSDDPAERFTAIHALERITGETFGYDHAAPRFEREPAVRRWVAWYADRYQTAREG